ncbi:MAG: TraB/GumN family protein [Proteobacteria bacterium]|nr:TraB/GumN family protein [Pseudomonadota bacterium]MBU1546971.1 TraB/GumN family protein [Pseudomonadota bacterium]MBU2618154.1 TraB/GumN family protein [Pseudomonadota bacterium]
MIEPTAESASNYPPDVHCLKLGDREIFLIGTAHISKESVDLVRQVIAAERPDCVCVELDEKRYEALAKRKTWELLDLREIIRKKQLSTLLINMLLASYQKRLGDQMGVKPGTELLEAVQEAEKYGIPVTLCDRDVRVTLRRAWQSTSFWRKNYLLASILTSMFEETEITEDKLRELKESDVLSELLSELGQAMPELKQVLIDERDTFLAEKIKGAEGKRLVAVVGAGHVAGIKTALGEDRSGQMEGINIIPPVSPVWKVIGWAIPAIIVLALVAIAVTKGAEVAGENVLFWILATGLPAAFGAILALAHPFTILGAFVGAPITTLLPVLGVGHLTAFIQVMAQPPLVIEFETVLQDMASVRGWWRNRLLRLFLAFMLPSIGAVAGMWVGGSRIISNLF